MLGIALPGGGIGALWFLVSYFGILSICEDSACYCIMASFCRRVPHGTLLRSFMVGQVIGICLPQYFPDAFQPFGERLAGAGDVDAQEPFSGVHFAFVDPYVPLLQ